MAPPLRILIAALVLAALAVPTVAAGALPVPVVDPTTAPARDSEAIILTGKDLPDWSVRSDASVKLPLTDLYNCSEASPAVNDHQPKERGTETTAHPQDFVEPEVDSKDAYLPEGTPTDELLGYRWDQDAHQFRQIPFQVDEMFTRYLDNSRSGFAVYSGEDQHTTYAFDREGFRFIDSDPSNPCLARPRNRPTTPDPIKGLDDNDELAFMASDAGPAAPADAKLPDGIDKVHTVSVVDPYTQKANYVYVMKALPNGPRAAYDASNGYVHYQRDANADFFAYSQSSYGSYGNALKGVYCDANGNVIPDPDPEGKQRRPRDTAWVTTPRYRFRYDGRWLMSQIHISPDGGKTYGPDLIDRWKARAFAQDPGSNTPCCGYEEEDTNWGGSSSLMGERSGPVRTIRETWGADSGTNVIRRETFYRDEVRQKSYLRVHVIPPLDGIYAQWDFNGGAMQKFFNPHLLAQGAAQQKEGRDRGVDIDGRNDEVFGNLDDPCSSQFDPSDDKDNNPSQFDQGYRSLFKGAQGCTDTRDLNGPANSATDPVVNRFPDPPQGELHDNLHDPFDWYHQSIDPGDPTFDGANASLNWSETAGPHGTIVDRIQVDKPTDLTPGGAAQSVAAVPYYRDDSCFDDGTGTDPGPKLHLRSADEPQTWSGGNRQCWHPEDGDPAGSEKYYQGSVGTHGLHLLFLVDSDNARQTVPVTEIVSEQRMVMLPGFGNGDEGEQYGRAFEKPLIPIVDDGRLAPLLASDDGGGNNGGGNPGGGNNTGSGGGGGGSASAQQPSGSASPAAQSPAPARTLRALLARTTLSRRGTFFVRCAVRGTGARRCGVAILAGGRVIGLGSARTAGGTVAVRVRLTLAGRRLVARARRGLTVRVLTSGYYADGTVRRVSGATRLRGN